MTDEKKEVSSDGEEFKDLLDRNVVKVPQVGELVRGKVITASKAEVKLDIDGVMTGVVRGPELYEEDDEYATLKPGSEVDATVIDDENENGELELSFRIAGQERAWAGIQDAYENKKIIRVRIVDANKGGLLAKYRQIAGFLPVSQLAPENYPRVSGGDKSKILDKLRSFAGQEFEVKVITLEEKDDKIIFSEKEAWNEKQQDVISKYKVGTSIEGKITAITDFGVFVSFGENLEGLIHISELAWQRIDDPGDLYKVGDTIKAEVISLENSKIFLSAKKLLKDPWENVGEKYKLGQTVPGIILKVNPFGLFVKLDDEIHGLAHVSQLSLSPGQRIYDKYKAKETINFEIVSMEPKEHRLGLAHSDRLDAKIEKKEAEEEAVSEEKKTDGEETEKEEKPKKAPKKEKAAKTEKKAAKEKKPSAKKADKTKSE
ncbi:MAG: S1 RNA-binding domain-containing protein [Candidatus Falkowbacteria bacterium]